VQGRLSGAIFRLNSHDVYCRIKAEVAFGRDVESATLISAKRHTLINFNAIAIAPPG
jgi:hypothetical protein